MVNQSSVEEMQRIIDSMQPASPFLMVSYDRDGFHVVGDSGKTPRTSDEMFNMLLTVAASSVFEKTAIETLNIQKPPGGIDNQEDVEEVILNSHDS